MNQRTSLLLALCAALQVIGTTQSASAVSILFRLDNLPNPSNAVPYTTTDNNICVHVKYNGSNWIPVGCKQLTTASNAHDYCLSGVSLWLMEEVKISTDGSNALWLDKWQAFSFASSDCTGSSTLQDSRGIDNDVGYLSDPLEFARDVIA